MQDAVDAIFELRSRGGGGGVFTANVDHVVMADEMAAFREAYGRAALVLADGMPLVWLSRLLGPKLPMRVAGSDLVEPIAARAAREGTSVYFLGGAPAAGLTPSVGEEAARVLSQRYPGLVVAGHSAPFISVPPLAHEHDEVVRALTAARPDFVFVALGAPKQELLIDAIAAAVAPAVCIGLGASLDFIAGRVRRAPPWMRGVGLEWLFRVAQEPRRLAHRYFVRDARLPWILLRHSLRRHP
jgi:N-acetylglucosaminyldiphosphoundecaprenol N-acetyl-beta-D-mannosaminyltransferase